MDEGIEGRIDAGKDGEMDEEKKKSTPEVIEKEAGKSKINTTGSQNRSKSVKKRRQEKQEIEARSSR